MNRTQIRGKKFMMTTWAFKHLAIVWTVDDGKGSQHGFCYSPRLSLNVFLGKRTLSFQPSDTVLFKAMEKEEIKSDDY